MPCQGHVYLSVNYLCFYSFIMGKQTTLKIRWTDVLRLEKNAKVFLPQSITVSTRERSVSSTGFEFGTGLSVSFQYNFSLFVSFEETYQLLVQLANIAMKQYVLCALFCLN